MKPNTTATTIRVPDDLYLVFVARARRNRRSINTELLIALEDSAARDIELAPVREA